MSWQAAIEESGRENRLKTASQTEPCAYELESVRFRYGASGSDGACWTLDGISLEVRSGEVLGIVGPNGSGKTSLLNLLARLSHPQEGDIRVFGRELASMSQPEVARQIGFVPQDTSQLFPFTVAETVLMGRFPYRSHSRWSSGFGWETREDIHVAERSMTTMDVAHLAHRLITELSGGERQRTVIARALAQTPKILLLDEPTAFLDLQHQMEICTVVRRLREEQGLTVVLVSHDLNIASQYCDRVVMLKSGRMFRIGRPSDVMSVEALREVYGCEVLVDAHPESGLPRVTLPRYVPRSHG